MSYDPPFSGYLPGAQPPTNGGSTDDGPWLPLSGGTLYGPLTVNGSVTAPSLPVNVMTFGAKIDGTTSDSAAVGAALASLKPQQSLYFPAGATSIVWGSVQGTTPTTPVLFDMDGTTAGGAPILRAFSRVHKGDIFSNFTGGLQYFSKRDPELNSQGVLYVEHLNDTTTGGTAAAISTPIRVIARDNTAAVTSTWGVHVQLDSYSNMSGWPQNVGVSSTLNKRGSAWAAGMHITAADYQNKPSSTGGAMTGMEIGTHFDGADDAFSGTTWGGTGIRAGMHLAFDPQVTSGPAEASAGIQFTVAGNTTIKSLLGVGVGSPTYQVLDTRGAVAPSGSTDPVAAVRALAGQIVDFNGGPALNSPPGNYLQYTTSGTARLRYMDAAVEVLAISDNGGLFSPSLPRDVRFYGAALDGTTNDTAAWAAARAAASDFGTITVPRGRQFVNTAPTTGPATKVLWKYDGNYIGSSGTTPVIGMGTDTVETFIGSKYFGRANSYAGAPAVVRIDSTLNHTSGGVVGTNTPTFDIRQTVTNTSPEGAFACAVTINSSRAGPGGDLVSVAGYANKLPTAGAHAMWGANFYTNDQTGKKSTLSGSSVGAEIAVLANDDDDGGGGSADVPAGQGIRVAIDVVGGKSVAGGVDAVLGWGVRVGPSSDLPGVSFRRNFAAYGPFLKSAFSTEFAVQQAGAHAVWLADGHHIALDSAGTRTLSYDSASGKLFFAVSGVNQFSIDASGNVRARGTVTGSTTP